MYNWLYINDTIIALDKVIAIRKVRIDDKTNALKFIMTENKVITIECTEEQIKEAFDFICSFNLKYKEEQEIKYFIRGGEK